MKDIIDALQKFLPWIAGLGLAPRIVVSVIVILVSILILLLIWMSPKKLVSSVNKAKESPSDVQLATLRIADIVVEHPKSLSPVVDIKLFNPGATVAFLTEISAIVLERVPYAALVKPSANYDLLIDTKRNVLKVAHEIPPNKTERITIRLGAAPHNLACYFRLQLEFTYNGEQVLVSEPFEVEFIE